MHLENRPRLKALIEEEQRMGASIRIQLLGPNVGVGFAQENQGVILNNYFLRVDDPNFSEDRLIVVLFHELGHMKYFAEVPKLERIQEDSEFRAFENSILETRRLAEQQNDPGPLNLAMRCIALRQISGREPQHYQAAIDRIIASELWKDCKDCQKNADQDSGDNS